MSDKKTKEPTKKERKPRAKVPYVVMTEDTQHEGVFEAVAGLDGSMTEKSQAEEWIVQNGEKGEPYRIVRMLTTVYRLKEEMKTSLVKA